MADSSVQIQENLGERQGQPQANPAALHDGTHVVHEVAVHTDKIILDPNSELAVQVPEGVGASTVGHRSPMGEALKAGTPEEQFAAAQKDDSEPEAEAKDEEADEREADAD